jgi:hypothetical protein
MNNIRKEEITVKMSATVIVNQPLAQLNLFDPNCYLYEVTLTP